MLMKTLTIKTNTGHAYFNNIYTKQGYKALWHYLRRLQVENKTFTGQFNKSL